MILFVVVALAALSVVVTGGSLGRLRHLRIRHGWCIALALAIQVLIVSVIPGDLPSLIARGLHLATYGLAVYFLWVNRRVPFLWLVGLGGLSNLVAISANGGVMPASESALRASGRLAESSVAGHFTNSGFHPGEHLAFLGDVFYVPRGWPLANVFSAGDILLAAGVALLLHSVAGSAPARALSHRRRGTEADTLAVA